MDKKLGQGPPLPPSFVKIQKNRYFFVKPTLTQSVRYVGIELLGQLKIKEVSLS